ARCASSRARSSAPIVPSMYSVTSSTNSRQVSAAATSPPLASSSGITKILREDATDPGSAAMKKHALIRLRQAENVTHFFGAPTLDITKADHLALRGGKDGDRAGDDGSDLARNHELLGGALPGRGRLPGQPVALVAEALRV